MSYWQESVRQEAIGLIDSLSRGEPIERDISLFARRYNAHSLSDLVRRIGLSPTDFSGIELTPGTVLDRCEGFVRSGRGYGRLRLWVSEIASVCMLATYLKSPNYSLAVDRSLRLLHLILDPAFIPNREAARRLVRLVLGHLHLGGPSPAPRVVRHILRSQREANLVTYRTGMPDRKWADVALVAETPGGRRASWFVPLTVISSDFEEPPGSHAGRSIPWQKEEAPWVEEDAASDCEFDLEWGRVYELAGRKRSGLLAYEIDGDGLSWVRCSSPTLYRSHFRLAAALFCAASGVAKGRLDGELLETCFA